jgi:preprotein translocase subunit SecA
MQEIEHLAAQKVIEAFKHKIAHEIEVIQQAQKKVHTSSAFLVPEGILQGVVRNVLIRSVDRLWQEHLLHIDHLRTEVHLRAIGQKDPLLEFKHEAFALFDSFGMHLKQEIAHALFKFAMVIPESPAEPSQRSPLEIPARFRLNLSQLTEDFEDGQ